MQSYSTEKWLIFISMAHFNYLPACYPKLQIYNLQLQKTSEAL